MAHTWFQWYQVQQGDTLSGIALYWYGNEDEIYWRRIWLANRQVIGDDPNDIQQWQWFRLPYWGFWYFIVGGDTLAQIAEWVYGDQNAYWIIVNANPQITDPNDIQANTWLWVP
jgi:nucleoid-associated protein YgaU